MRDYGRQLLRYFWWRYDMSAAGRFLSIAGRELRFYGITVPGTQWGLGVFVSRKTVEQRFDLHFANPEAFATYFAEQHAAALDARPTCGGQP